MTIFPTKLTFAIGFTVLFSLPNACKDGGRSNISITQKPNNTQYNFSIKKAQFSMAGSKCDNGGITISFTNDSANDSSGSSTLSGCITSTEMRSQALTKNEEKKELQGSADTGENASDSVENSFVSLCVSQHEENSTTTYVALRNYLDDLGSDDSQQLTTSNTNENTKSSCTQLYKETALLTELNFSRISPKIIDVRPFLYFPKLRILDLSNTSVQSALLLADTKIITIKTKNTPLEKAIFTWGALANSNPDP